MNQQCCIAIWNEEMLLSNSRIPESIHGICSQINDKKGIRLVLYVEEQLINAFYPLREEHNLEE